MDTLFLTKNMINQTTDILNVYFSSNSSLIKQISD